MSNRHLISAILLTVGFSASTAADELDESFQLLSQQLKEATVRLDLPGDRASGVLVSESGYILTVAHGIPKNKGDQETTVRIFLSNGTLRYAKVIAIDWQADLALLKLSGAGKLPGAIVPIDVPSNKSSADSKRTALQARFVLACGYPGRQPNGAEPLVRLGTIITDRDIVLKSTCTLTAGDSGGPLVSLNGQLVGIHQRIGLSLTNNQHVPHDRIITFLKASDSSGVVQSEIAVANVYAGDKGQLQSQMLEDQLRQLPAKHEAALKKLTAAIELPIGDARDGDARDAASQSGRNSVQRLNSANPTIWAVVAMGTVLDASHVATKLSLLQGWSECRVSLPSGESIRSRLVRSQQQHDLAILKLNRPTSFKATEREPDSVVRGLVISLTSNGNAQVGFVGRSTCDEPSAEGRLGIQLSVAATGKQVNSSGDGTEIKSNLVVDSVSVNSTGSIAGIIPGDRIIKVNGVAPSTLDQMQQILQTSQPGDWLHFSVQRGERQLDLSAPFGFDPATLFVRSEFLDGRSGPLSERRTGFIGVIQHDTPVHPVNCGNPMLDSSGRLVGIHIARRARESTLALPVSVVWELLNSEPGASQQ